MKHKVSDICFSTTWVPWIKNSYIRGIVGAQAQNQGASLRLRMGPIAIDASSITRLPDGRIQFAITAGPGATQVTVWGSTLLSSPAWTPIATVPLTSGRGVFTENTPATAPTRFYRVTAP